MSTVGSRTGTPPTSRSATRAARPSGRRHTSVDVPPMSNAIAFAKPARRASSPAPTTPPAGPETSNRAGCAAASPTEDDAARREHHDRLGQPRVRRRARERVEIRRRHRREVRIDRRRRGALVLAELRRDLVRRDDVHAGIPPPQLLRHRDLVRRVAEGEEQAHRDRLDVRPELGQRFEIERLELAVGAEPPRDAVTIRQRDDRLGMRRAQPVQVRPRLPPQVEQMLEAGVADERRARAAPLEQRVRRDRRPVREPLEHNVPRADGARRGEHRLLLPRRGRDLRHPDLPVRDEHRVGERPAHIDAENRHDRTLHRRGDPRLPLRLRRADPRHRAARRAPAGRCSTASTATSCREDLWATLVGTTHAPWSPMDHLEQLVGTPLDRAALNEHRYAHELSLIEAEELRPGIVDYLAAARRHGLKRAIVSSSSRRWVDMHIARFEETLDWDAICHRRRRRGAREAVADALPRSARRCSTSRRRKRSRSRTRRTASAPRKPRGSSSSPSRTRSTRGLGLDAAGADLLLDSLADLPPEELLERFAVGSPHELHIRRPISTSLRRRSTRTGSRSATDSVSKRSERTPTAATPARPSSPSTTRSRAARPSSTSSPPAMRRSRSTARK